MGAKANKVINTKFVGNTFKISDQATHRTLDDILAGFERSRRAGKYGAYKVCREKTLLGYQKDLNPFLNTLKTEGIRQWSAVTQQRVQKYIDDLKMNRNLEQSSKAHILRSLKAFFNYIPLDPDNGGLKTYDHLIPRIESGKAKLWIPEPDVMQRFWNSLKESGLMWDFRDYVILAIMLDCGPRPGEIRFLKEEHLKLEANTLLIPEEGKTGSRVVPITPETVTLVKKWLSLRSRFAKTDWVFVNKWGGQMGESLLPQSFDRVRQRLEITDDIVPYTGRHFFATHYLVNGGTLSDLKAILGHTSYETLNWYVNQAAMLSKIRHEHHKFSPMATLAGARFATNGPVKKKRRTV